jgi:phosphoenolpyruvate phosphomutase
MDKAFVLRRRVNQKGLVRVLAAHDALSAILAEEAGADAIWAGGLGISASHGQPDASILTMSELLETTRWINDAVSIPVIADCDEGFGDANNVAHMVRRYEAAGVAAVCIEDKLFPKLNSFALGPQPLLPIDAFVQKLAAAKAAQRSASFMVIARTEALIAGQGQAEARRRAEAYVAAGADALVVHSKARTSHELATFMADWDRRAPMVAIPTTYPDVTTADLERMGVKIVIYANQGIRAAANAIAAAFAAIIASGTSRHVEASLLPVADLLRLTGTDRVGSERSAA